MRLDSQPACASKFPLALQDLIVGDHFTYVTCMAHWQRALVELA